MVHVKNLKVFSNLFADGLHPHMIQLLWWIASDNGIGYLPTITSAYRKGDKGVHGTIPCRGVDLRTWGIRDPNVLVRMINNAWIYDPARPRKKCAIYHDVGKGHHIHLQTHPNTKRR